MLFRSVKIFSDSRVIISFLNNFWFVLISTAGQIILGFIVAIVISRVVKTHQNMVRTLLFIPVVLPSVAAAQIWSKIYAITPQLGVLNSILKMMGLDQLMHAWTGEMETAMGALIVVAIWKSFGMYVLLFYSGIIDISEDILEACAIDGANTLQTVFYVQMPLLKNVLRMSLVMILTAGFKTYDAVVALTNGGPGTATLMPSMYMYSTAFTSGNFGYGSVIAILILIECALSTFVVNKLLSKGNTI